MKIRKKITTIVQFILKIYLLFFLFILNCLLCICFNIILVILVFYSFNNYKLLLFVFFNKKIYSINFFIFLKSENFLFLIFFFLYLLLFLVLKFKQNFHIFFQLSFLKIFNRYTSRFTSAYIQEMRRFFYILKWLKMWEEEREKTLNTFFLRVNLKRRNQFRKLKINLSKHYNFSIKTIEALKAQLIHDLFCEYLIFIGHQPFVYNTFKLFLLGVKQIESNAIPQQRNLLLNLIITFSDIRRLSGSTLRFNNLRLNKLFFFPSLCKFYSNSALLQYQTYDELINNKYRFVFWMENFMKECEKFSFFTLFFILLYIIPQFFHFFFINYFILVQKIALTIVNLHLIQVFIFYIFSKKLLKQFSILSSRTVYTFFFFSLLYCIVYLKSLSNTIYILSNLLNICLIYIVVFCYNSYYKSRFFFNNRDPARARVTNIVKIYRVSFVLTSVSYILILFFIVCNNYNIIIIIYFFLIFYIFCFHWIQLVFTIRRLICKNTKRQIRIGLIYIQSCICLLTPTVVGFSLMLLPLLIFMNGLFFLFLFHFISYI